MARRRPPNAGKGRKKGVPNKLTQAAREAFQAVYEGRLQDLDRWIQETGDGFEITKLVKRGKRTVKLTFVGGKDPGKAAEILTRMAEHFVPKLQRIEKTIADSTDEELLAEVRRRKEQAAVEKPPAAKV